jgi:hypothetical protein
MGGPFTFRIVKELHEPPFESLPLKWKQFIEGLTKKKKKFLFF